MHHPSYAATSQIKTLVCTHQHIHTGKRAGGPFASDGTEANIVAKIGNSGCEFVADSSLIALYPVAPAISWPFSDQSWSEIRWTPSSSSQCSGDTIMSDAAVVRASEGGAKTPVAAAIASDDGQL